MNVHVELHKEQPTHRPWQFPLALLIKFFSGLPTKKSKADQRMVFCILLLARVQTSPESVQYHPKTIKPRNIRLPGQIHIRYVRKYILKIQRRTKGMSREKFAVSIPQYKCEDALCMKVYSWSHILFAERPSTPENSKQDKMVLRVLLVINSNILFRDLRWEWMSRELPYRK